MATKQYSFGTGVLFGRKSGSNPTPIKFGALQGVTVDITYNKKELRGQYTYPLDIGRGTASITGKADYAQLNALAFNDLFFSESAGVVTGMTVNVDSEAQTVTSNAVTVTHNSTFYQDLGVVNASDGTTFQRVGSGPVGQQYTCNESTGVYSFNSSQNNVGVYVSYDYADASNGSSITLTNPLVGSAPTFLMVLSNTYKSNAIRLQLNSCMSSKLSLATKLEDHMVPGFEFSAYADSGNNVGKLSLQNL